MRELVWMAHGRRRASWEWAGTIIATLKNCHRDPKAHPEPFIPMNPYQTANQPPAASQPMKVTAREQIAWLGKAWKGQKASRPMKGPPRLKKGAQDGKR